MQPGKKQVVCNVGGRTEDFNVGRKKILPGGRSINRRAEIVRDSEEEGLWPQAQKATLARLC